MTANDLAKEYKKKYRTGDICGRGEIINIGKESFQYYLDDEITNSNKLRFCLYLEVDFNASFADLIDAEKTFLSTESLEKYLISLMKLKIKDLKEVVKDYTLSHKKQKTEKLYRC